jgi:hypothetical protein
MKTSAPPPSCAIRRRRGRRRSATGWAKLASFLDDIEAVEGA